MPSSASGRNRFAPPEARVDAPVEDEPPELVPAGRGRRLAAHAIDFLPVAVIVPAMLAAIAMPAYRTFARRASGDYGPAATDSTPTNAALAVGVALLLAWLGWNCRLVHRHGQSFGKRLLRIRVVRRDGGRVTLGRFVVMRWLPMWLAGLVPYFGKLLWLVDSGLAFRGSGRCLHDEIADTIVVTAASSPRATLAGSRGEHLRTFRG